MYTHSDGVPTCPRTFVPMAVDRPDTPRHDDIVMAYIVMAADRPNTPCHDDIVMAYIVMAADRPDAPCHDAHTLCHAIANVFFVPVHTRTHASTHARTHTHARMHARTHARTSMSCHCWQMDPVLMPSLQTCWICEQKLVGHTCLSSNIL